MKKNVVLFIVLIISGFVFAKDRPSGKIVLGGSPIEKNDGPVSFGNIYLMADVTGENDYVTAGGKFYYRLSLSDDTKDLDKKESLSQKMDLKRAYLRVRPFGKEILEISIGKLYSYYLPGNYFSLSETYTGNSRWGKSGLGLKYEDHGFTIGVALPLTENYSEIKNTFNITGAIGYDFKNLNENLLLKIGASFFDSYRKTETKDDIMKSNDFGFTVSGNFAKKIQDKNFSLNTTLSYSWNGEPYVASSVFKNVSNYNAPGLSKSQFVSFNQNLDFKNIKITLEGEIGKSLENSWIPIYSGVQGIFNIIEELSFRPRFYYYASLNFEDKNQSRNTFEIYPRLWFEKGKWLMAIGPDLSYKQKSSDDWQLEWSIPFFVEFKF